MVYLHIQLQLLLSRVALMCKHLTINLTPRFQWDVLTHNTIGCTFLNKVNHVLILKTCTFKGVAR